MLARLAILPFGLRKPGDEAQIRLSDSKSAAWRFDLPSQNATRGIAAFLGQAGAIQILASQDALRGRRTNRLKGNYCIEPALTLLLAGSGLQWLRTGQNTYAIVAKAEERNVKNVSRAVSWSISPVMV